MEDIIWYLHKFIKPYQYSLLNKKCRKTYFDKYGVELPNYDPDNDGPYKQWQYEFLAGNKLHLKINWFDYPSDIIYNIEEYYHGNGIVNNPYKEKILSNIVSVSSGERGIHDTTLILIKKLPNVRKISGDIVVSSTEDIAFCRRFLPMSKKLYVGICPTFRWKSEAEMKKIMNENNAKLIIDIDYLSVYDDYLDYIGELADQDDEEIGNGEKLPELTKLGYFSSVPNIIAPKLEKIKPENIFVAYKIAKKFSTITKFRKGTKFRFENIKEFREAYNFLKDFRFSLGVKVEDLVFLLELEVSDKIVRTIYLNDPYDISPKILEDVKKIFFVEKSKK